MNETNYTPPFTITSKVLSLVARICEEIGRLSAESNAQEFRLRRANRIRTIHGSLAIEGNTLTEEQIVPFSMESLLLLLLEKFKKYVMP